MVSEQVKSFMSKMENSKPDREVNWKDPRVSVCVTTYNHAAFISQALDSVLAQNTDFSFEILVGEDDSSDGTRDIVRNYAERHPQIIRPFFNSRENVIKVNGRATGRWNFMNNIRHARGEYIALLDGDDWWLSPDKLNRQVKELDAQPQCSFSFHNVKIWNEVTCKFEGTLHSAELPRFFGIEQVLTNFIIPTGSVVFRRGLFGNFPDWFTHVIMADWPLHVLNSQFGPGLYMKDIMGAYRRHPSAAWVNIPRSEQLLGHIECAKIIDKHLDYRWTQEIAHSIGLLGGSLVAAQCQEGLHAKALQTVLSATLKHEMRTQAKVKLLALICKSKLKSLV